MQKTPLILTMFLIFSNLSLAQTATDKVWNAVLLLDKAITEKDSAGLKLILTDDFMGAIPTGRAFTKIDFIRYHCHAAVAPIVFLQYPMGQAVIHLRDNTAVVNRQTHATLRKPDGSMIDYEIQRIEVCYKVKSEWRVAREHSTEINIASRQ